MQKAAPFILIGMWVESPFLALSAGGRALIGGVGGLNQSSLRGIVAYSSFVHSSWMLVATVESLPIFEVYFVSYSVLLGVLVGSCSVLNRRLFYRGSGSLLGRLSMLRLSGIPPFGGFVPKLLLLISVDYKGILICPLLGRVIAIKYYVSSACSMALECGIRWDRRLFKWCWVFVTFSFVMYGVLF